MISSFHGILTTEVAMHRLAAKFVLQLLTYDLRDNCIAICKGLLDPANTDKNIIKKYITGDTMWVYRFNVVTKMQSSQWAGKILQGQKMDDRSVITNSYPGTNFESLVLSGSAKIS